MANIKALVSKNDTDIELEVVLNPPKNKILKVNGISSFTIKIIYYILYLKI